MQSEVSSLGDSESDFIKRERESCREVHVLQGGSRGESNAACPGVPIVNGFLEGTMRLICPAWLYSLFDYVYASKEMMFADIRSQARLY